jgi:hypothetical protein
LRSTPIGASSIRGGSDPASCSRASPISFFVITIANALWTHLSFWFAP